MTHRVKYLGASRDQVAWGGCDDPRPLLTVGNIYIVAWEDVHSYHTKLHLKGFQDNGFNSVSFRRVK